MNVILPQLILHTKRYIHNESSNYEEKWKGFVLLRHTLMLRHTLTLAVMFSRTNDKVRNAAQVATLK